MVASAGRLAAKRNIARCVTPSGGCVGDTAALQTSVKTVGPSFIATAAFRLVAVCKADEITGLDNECERAMFQTSKMMCWRRKTRQGVTALTVTL